RGEPRVPDRFVRRQNVACRHRGAVCKSEIVSQVEDYGLCVRHVPCICELRYGPGERILVRETGVKEVGEAGGGGGGPEAGVEALRLARPGAPHAARPGRRLARAPCERASPP